MQLQPSQHIPPGPRPAQVISLEDFEEGGHSNHGGSGIEGDGESAWHHGCRCGGIYIITGEDMEKGHHIVGCNSCSEVVWVGYELREDEGEEIN